MDEKNKFGLVMPKKEGTLKMKSKSIFESDSDEDAPKSKRPKIPQKKIDLKKITKKDVLEDPSIYEYDSIYDDMKAKQAESIAPKEKKNSRYIETLLKAADKRKMEYERRVEKKIQVERVKEGDKFKDKESFVTSTYKKKMQEREEEEERERREAMLNNMMDVTKQKDLSGFYRHFLKQTVGEEKIPTFGEKRIKDEVMSDEEKPVKNKKDKSVLNIKEELDEIKEALDNSRKIIKINPKTQAEFNIDQDSDGIEIDSDSDEQDHDSSRKASSKTQGKNDSALSSSESNREVENKSGKQKKGAATNVKSNSSKYEKQSKTYRKSKTSLSSESESEEENVSKEENSSKNTDKLTPDDQIRNKPKINIHRPRHDSSDDSNKADTTLNYDRKPDDKLKNSDNKKITRRNIYAKRTIGDVFAEAQARYFQRMAERNT